VDGSVPLSEQRTSVSGEAYDQYATMSHCTSASDDRNTDTPASISDSLSQDYQDNSSVEIDESAYFTRQAIDTPKSGNATDVWVNGHHGKPGLLSSRLQNLHVSNGENVTDTSPRSSPERFKEVQPRHEISDQDGSRSKQSGLERGLPPSGASPAADPNGPSAIGKRRSNIADSSGKLNAATHKTKPKNRHDGPHNISSGPGDSKERHIAHAPRKPNGINAPTHDSVSNHGSNGWQTTKKKQKKNAKPMEPRSSFHVGAEPLPVDESLRKGG
jgi:hypothetical protein